MDGGKRAGYIQLIPETLNMYTAEKWDVLGCAFPTTKRLPEAREISRGPGDFHRSTGNFKVGGRYNLIHLNSRKCTVILSLLIHPWGCIRKYNYNYGGKMSIVSVKINTSLVGEGSKTLITEGGMKGTIHDLRASPSGNQPHILRWLNGCDQEPPQDESDDCLAK